MSAHGPRRAAALLTLAATATGLAYCVWGLDRGFEITDEAYYLLVAMHPVSFYVSAQHWITSLMWDATGSLVSFRAAGLACVALSSALLGYGAFVLARRLSLVEATTSGVVTVVSASVAGGILYASTINLSPSYNLLASCGAYAGGGLVALNLATKSSKRMAFVLVIAGLGVGVVVISKASAGVATWGILGIWICLLTPEPRAKLRGVALLTAGAIVAVVLALLVNTTFEEAVGALTAGLELFTMVQTESPGARLLRYIGEFALGWVITAWAFAVPLILTLVYASTGRQWLLSMAMGSLTLILLFGGMSEGRPILSWDFANGEQYLFGGLGRYAGQVTAMLAILLVAFVASFRPGMFPTRSIFFLGGLVALPYAVAIGSGNSIFTQVIVSLAPWGALIAVLSLTASRSALAVAPALFAILASAQVTTSGYRPYHLAAPVADQSVAITASPIGQFRVDPVTAVFVHDLMSARSACQLDSNVPILALYNIPGVALMVDQRPPLSPWINHERQGNYLLDAMSEAEIEAATIAVQLTAAGDLPPMPEKLGGFPAGYRKCAAVKHPFGPEIIEVWAPAG